MKRESMSKITGTQNAIRSEFKRAHAKRLQHEHAVTHVMKPLAFTSTTIDSNTENSDFSIHRLSRTTTETNDSPHSHLN